MREKLRPWIAAMFCAALCIVLIIGKFLAIKLGLLINPMEAAFYSFLPMCFFVVGDFLSALRKENLALRKKIDELSSEFLAKTISKPTSI